MKTVFTRLFSILMFSVAVFTACEEMEENPQKAEPAFPAETFSEFLYPETEANASAEDEIEFEYEIVFTPNYNWTLSIPTQEAASYFRLRSGAQDVFTVRGNASEEPVSITIYCRAGERDFEDHSVDVTLTMNGQDKVIGTVTLPSLKRKFDVYQAKTDENGFVAATDGGVFSYQYETEALTSDKPVSLIWNDLEAVYEGYVIVDANSDWTLNLEKSDSEITVSEISGHVSGTRKEVRITSSLVAQEDNTFQFVLELTDENVSEEEKTHTYSVLVPAFSTAFNVYPVEVDGNGDYVVSDDEAFTMSYASEPVAEGSDINLEYVTESGQYISYILVDANFEYTDIAATIDDEGNKPDYLDGIVPEWLDVKEVGASGTKREFRITVSAENYALEGDSAPLVFYLSENIQYSYNIILPASQNLFEVALSHSGTSEFNSEGQAYNSQMGQYVEDGAAIGVTSADGLVIYELSMNETGWYVMDKNENFDNPEMALTDWIHTEWSWNAADLGLVQTNNITVTVDPNTGEARRGMVIALPAEINAEAVAAAAGHGGDMSLVLSLDGKTVAPEYENYVVTIIEQAADPSAAGIVIDTEYEANWEALSGTLEALSSSDQFYGKADYGYQITYRWNEWASFEGTTSFGGELLFNINLTYTDYDVYSVDASGNPDMVTDKDNYWIRLVKSEGKAHYILIAPEDMNNIVGGQAYFALKNADGEYVAIIKFSYEIDSALSLSLVQGQGCTLTEVPEADRPENAGSSACWLLEYTGNAEGALAVISGLPSDVSYVQPSAGWLSAESMGGGSYSVDIQPSLAEEGDTEGYIQFGAGTDSSMRYVLYLIVRMNITE